jgi:hypothetical protein
MGCGASTAQTERKGSVSAAVVTTGKGSYTSIINEKSPHIRLDQSIEMRKAEIDCPSISYSLEYCKFSLNFHLYPML